MNATAMKMRESAIRVPERILTAAARLMERDGYDGTSMREIADAAGMTKPGLYYHAASKEFLLFAIHDRFATPLLEHAEAVLASECAASEKLRDLLRRHMETIGQFQPEGRVFLREYGRLTGELKSFIDEQRDRYRVIYETVVQQGVASGEFCDGDVHLDAMSILGACNFAAFWFDPKGPRSIEELAEHFAERMLNGLRRHDRPAGGTA